VKRRSAARRSSKVRLRVGRVAEPTEEAVRAAQKRIATDVVALAAGFDVWSRHVTDEATSGAARSVAQAYGAIARSLAGGATRTGDRLRWEWLASTAALLDGAPHARIGAEVDRFADELERALRVLDRDAASNALAMRVRGALSAARVVSAALVPQKRSA
jgi:hypothetical protein